MVGSDPPAVLKRTTFETPIDSTGEINPMSLLSPLTASRSGRPQIGLFALLAMAVTIVAACTGPAVANPPASAGAVTQPGASAGPSSTMEPGSTPNGDPGAEQSAPPATPGPTLPRVPVLKPPAYASRVVVSALEIDLPVISGDLQPPPSYPFCDVAAYVTRFKQPYEIGLTYISAHAQRGMFAPLLKASERNDGAELLGMAVQVYTNDGRRFDYHVTRVVRHALDYAVLNDISLDQQNLILQTSEGVYGTLEKLQVIAAFDSETTVELAEANPVPMPRDCEPDAVPSPAAP